MPVSPLDALKNAAHLATLNSAANMTPGAPGGDPSSVMVDPTDSGISISGGATPSAFDQRTGEANLDSIAALLRSSQAGQEAARRQGMVDQQADLDSGLPLHNALDEQHIKNAVGDEAAAGQFMPFTEQLYNRTQADKTNLANMQYVLPSILKSQADLQGHTIDAQGRLAAAQAGHPQKSPLDYLLEALQGAAAKGIIFQPDELATLKQQYGIQ